MIKQIIYTKRKDLQCLIIPYGNNIYDHTLILENNLGNLSLWHSEKIILILLTITNNAFVSLTLILY